MRALVGHGKPVTSLAALEIDGSLALASGSGDNTIRRGTRAPERPCASSKGIEAMSPASLRSKSTDELASPRARGTTRFACGTRKPERPCGSSKGIRPASLASPLLESTEALRLASSSFDKTIRNPPETPPPPPRDEPDCRGAPPKTHPPTRRNATPRRES